MVAAEAHRQEAQALSLFPLLQARQQVHRAGTQMLEETEVWGSQGVFTEALTATNHLVG